MALGGNLQRLGAVLRREDLVTLADEVVSDEFEDVHLVVHQQDAMAHCRQVLGRRTGVRRGVYNLRM